MTHRLRKHDDYQRVYKASRKHFTKQFAYFYALRPALGPDGKPTRSDTPGPRIGLTVPKVFGKAVDRNRIKRRLREAVRKALPLLNVPVDVILHPRRTLLTLDFTILESELAAIFRAVESAAHKSQTKNTTPQP
jgi:ribonuclease P protein component